MRLVLCLSLFSLLFLTACKDEENPTPQNSVTIGGASYTTVTIGTLTWTATNYAGAGGIAYDALNSKPEYGKYYTKAEVDAFILPDGWRIPTEEDYRKLAEHVGLSIPSTLTDTEKIKMLTSKEHWNNAPGTNGSGFNAYPTGYSFQNSLPIDGDIAEFWTASGLTLSIQEAGLNASSLRMVFYQSNTSPEYRFTVRLVKDK